MNKLALLPLLALVFTIGMANTAYAISFNMFDFGGHNFSTDENISENPATADRKISPLNDYGFETMKSIVCGDHLCADGELPPRLHADGDYSRGD